MVRLDDALPALRAALEAGLQAAAPRPSAPYAVLGTAAEGSANAAAARKGRILLTLAGLRGGAAARNLPPARAQSGAPAERQAGALEADVLMTADYPGQYLRGLHMMTRALDWVHDNPVLSAGGAAGAGAEADRFMVERVDLGYEEAAALVGMAGVKGAPFALLRLRGLSVGGGS
ncbi:MAG TPA: Pvc16 family protein [Allosphingosinicella sp.]|nr:Pvc16 family protein [Allosphingosinicella sp.]